MTQEMLGLQAHGVAIRLVQSVTQLNLAGMVLPAGPGVGGQQNVLGVQFIPSWAGINGPRGYTQGQFELRLYQEGAFSLTLPNAEGEDGLLHRNRFLILATGKVTPLGGNAVGYQGGAFRPGDEFVEIYRTNSSGAPGRLLCVGAITKASIDGGQIVLEGSDALWLLKKARETTAGFHVLAPRDAIEHFTRTKQVVIADDFPNDGRFSYSTAPQTTADGQWSYVAASNQPGGALGWGPQLGTSVRIGVNGSVRTASKILGCSGFHGLDPSARVEARWRAQRAGSGQIAAMMVGGSSFGWAVYVDSTGAVTFGTYTLTGLLASVSAKTAAFNRAAWHTSALEFRDRFVFAFLDGVLVATMPQAAWEDQAGQQSPSGWAMSVFPPAALASLDVDYVVARQLQPSMLRPPSPANLGDYQLGGTPAAGSCELEIWRYEDLVPFGTAVSGLEFSPPRISQRVSVGTVPSPVLPPVSAGNPGWWPAGAGLYAGGSWAARVKGALQLSLGSFDYRFQVNQQSGTARLWVGKTRMGEQLLDDWGNSVSRFRGGIPPTSVTPYLKATGIPAMALTAAAIVNNQSLWVGNVPAGVGAGQLVQIGATGGASPPDYAYLVFAVPGNASVELKPPQAGFSSLPRTAWPVGTPVTVLNQGSLANSPTGWYPFVLEIIWPAPVSRSTTSERVVDVVPVNLAARSDRQRSCPRPSSRRPSA